MSRSHNKRQKKRKAERSVEEKKIRRQIREGKLPLLHFAKADDKGNLEREVVWLASGRRKNKLTWRMASTLAVLLKD